MKKMLMGLLLLAGTFAHAQWGQGHATGSDYVMVNQTVGQWSIFDPFWIVNKTLQPITLKRIYGTQIAECIGQQDLCPATQNFKINTFCGAAHGGNLIEPAVIQPGAGCLTYFQWRPTFVGMRTWVVTFEAVADDGSDISLVVATQGTGQ